jgi:hypothetical protein
MRRIGALYIVSLTISRPNGDFSFSRLLDTASNSLREWTSPAHPRGSIFRIGLPIFVATR